MAVNGGGWSKLTTYPGAVAAWVNMDTVMQATAPTVPSTLTSNTTLTFIGGTTLVVKENITDIIGMNP